MAEADPKRLMPSNELKRSVNTEEGRYKKKHREIEICKPGSSYSKLRLL